MITFGPTIRHQDNTPTGEIVDASRNSMAKIIALFNASPESADSGIRIEPEYSVDEYFAGHSEGGDPQ